MERKPMMTSLYHLNGAELRMTNYCAAGNQPRLKANNIEENNIQFEFVDATDLSSPADAHVVGLKLQIKDENNITLIFTFQKASVNNFEQIDLSRIKSN